MVHIRKNSRRDARAPCPTRRFREDSGLTAPKEWEPDRFHDCVDSPGSCNQNVDWGLVQALKVTQLRS